MKKYVHFFMLALLLAGMALTLPFFHSCEELYDDVLRVHIRANSDSAADQSLKLAVRDRVLSECSRYYADCADKDDALAVTRAVLPQIKKAAEQEVRAHGCTYPVRAELARMRFDTRYYEDFTMPAGEYDALRLTIGEGEGQNWWCVMYPSLCVGACAQSEMQERLDDGEYSVVTADRLDLRFKLVEVFEDIRAWFCG